jgi:hypothetical protein
MILGFIFPAAKSTIGVTAIEEINTVPQLIMEFVHALPEYAEEIGLAVAPLIAVFILFQAFALKLPKAHMVRIAVGLVYTFFGLTIFLTGVGVGFMPAGTFIGEFVGGLTFKWILIPLGVLMGYFIVLAEPAVHVLVEQVEDLTGGAITKKTMLRAFSISVGAAVALAMIRVVTGISIWYMLVPGYGIAIVLSMMVPKIFTSLAFDSGAVASGPMTATFILPFTVGACAAAGGNMMMDAFGVVAMVAMMPLVTVQVIGFIYDRKMRHAKAEEAEVLDDIAADIESHKQVDWGKHVSSYSTEVIEDYMLDTEYAASDEWIRQVHKDEERRTVQSDNNYIEFDKCTVVSGSRKE